MKKNLLHYGLQRSGTNFMETLLLKNFKLEFHNSNLDRSHPIQKHFRLYDEKHLIPDSQYDNNLKFKNFNNFLDTLELNTPIDGVIVVSKDPYSWLTSYKKWGVNCNWTEVGHHYGQEYDLFYKKWLEFSKQDERILFVKYLDLLTNAREELERIESRFKLSRRLMSQLRGIQSNLKKVSHSKAFTANRMDFYLKKEYLKDYTPDELDALNGCISDEVLLGLGYERSIKNP